MIFKRNIEKRIFTSLILFLFLYIIYRSNFILTYFLILIGIYSVLEFSKLMKKILSSDLKNLLLNIFFISYTFLLCLVFIIFSNITHLKILLFIILFGCIFSDIGGFVFGKIFRGPKLTKISPNKTISGSIGSFLFSYFIIQILIFKFLGNFSINILFISLSLSFACQIGDLIFSFIKRKAKVKDTGNLLPGHGGILDRLDGILIGLPVGLIAFFLFL